MFVVRWSVVCICVGVTFWLVHKARLRRAHEDPQWAQRKKEGSIINSMPRKIQER